MLVIDALGLLLGGGSIDPTDPSKFNSWESAGCADTSAGWA